MPQSHRPRPSPYTPIDVMRASVFLLWSSLGGLLLLFFALSVVWLALLPPHGVFASTGVDASREAVRAAVIEREMDRSDEISDRIRLRRLEVRDAVLERRRVLDAQAGIGIGWRWGFTDLQSVSSTRLLPQ